MKKIFYAVVLAIFLLAASSCAIQISQDAGATPGAQSAGNTPTVETLANPALPGYQIPVTWGDLQLSGKLVYISGGENFDSLTMSIQVLDLKTGQVVTIFQGPDNSFIHSVSVSPDRKQVLISYSPPLSNNMIGNPAVYIMPMDASTPPELLFTPPTQDDEYFRPEWSEDGKYIYLTYTNHRLPTPEGQLYPSFMIYRISYPDGSLEKIIDGAFWPRGSADATRLVYVSIEQTDGTNKLFLANADGTDAKQVTMTGKWIPRYIDAPIFSPDGQSILFSAVSLSPVSSSTWLEKLLGITVASAHNIPSDWWSVPIAGGPATQLTHLQTTGLFASISPDKKYIASDSGYGLFVMKADGTGVQMLANNQGGVPSSISWIP